MNTGFPDGYEFEVGAPVIVTDYAGRFTLGTITKVSTREFRVAYLFAGYLDREDRFLQRNGAEVDGSARCQGYDEQRWAELGEGAAYRKATSTLRGLLADLSHKRNGLNFENAAGAERALDWFLEACQRFQQNGAELPPSIQQALAERGSE